MNIFASWSAKDVAAHNARVRMKTAKQELVGECEIKPYEDNISREVSNAILERDQAAALERTASGTAEGIQRTLVRFVGYRVRPLDPDNFAGSVKSLLDGLRHARIILGDEPWRIILETEQVKVGKFKDEKTVIEIIT